MHTISEENHRVVSIYPNDAGGVFAKEGEEGIALQIEFHGDNDYDDPT